MILNNISKIQIFACSIASTAVIGLFLTVYLPSRRKQTISSIPDKDIISVELLENESFEFTVILPSISTITFYEGSPDENYLRNRVAGIVELNPWLSGHLVYGNRGRVNLRFQNKSPSQDFFHVSDKSTIGEDFPLDVNVKETEQYLVKTGKKCLQDSREPLFRVTLIKISEQKFAIIFSLSHIIGDGYTFYKLYSMMDEKLAIYSFKYQRDHSFVDLIKNMNDTCDWFLNIGNIINFIYTALLYPNVKIQIQKIDSNWIKSQKQNESLHLSSKYKDVAFVSTNDVLTTWIMNKLNYDVSVMAINCRNRVTGITSELAGNYESVVAYRPADYAEPALIRKSLSCFHRQVTGPLPSVFQSLFLKRVSIISSWSTFFHQVELADCTHKAHFPHISQSDTPCLFDVHVIFNVSKDQMACWSCTRYYQDHVFPALV